MQPVSAINSFPAASAIVPQGNLGGRNVLNLNARGVDAFLASAAQFCKKAFTTVKNAVIAAFAFVMRYLNVAWNWIKSTYSANPRLFQVGAAAFAAGAAIVAAINACRNKPSNASKPEEPQPEETGTAHNRTEHADLPSPRTPTRNTHSNTLRSNERDGDLSETSTQATRPQTRGLSHSNRPRFAALTDRTGVLQKDSQGRQLFVQRQQY